MIYVSTVILFFLGICNWVQKWHEAESLHQLFEPFFRTRRCECMLHASEPSELPPQLDLDACPALHAHPVLITATFWCCCTEAYEGGEAPYYGADQYDIRMRLVPSPYCTHCRGPISHPVPLPIPAPAPVNPSHPHWGGHSWGVEGWC